MGARPSSKNRHAQILGRRGGSVKSERKSTARRIAMQKRWKLIRSGKLPMPKLGRPKKVDKR